MSTLDPLRFYSNWCPSLWSCLWENKMADTRAIEATVVLKAYQSAIERHIDQVAAMEEGILALDNFRGANRPRAAGENPIDADLLFANRLKTRAAVVQCIAGAFIEREWGMTLDAMAVRLDTTRRKVKKMMSLRGQDGHSVDQVSDLLLALGTELDFQVEKRSRAEPAPADAAGD
jgi:hypothetical protein